jgi:predicted anti-sigma-YlaC factor YlaD
MRVVTAVLALLLGSCTTLAVGMVGGALGSGTMFAQDDDPELVAAAVPFALKSIEGLLAADPDNEDLLLAAAAGFARYAYGFVLQDAREIEPEDFARSRELTERGRRLLARSFEYGLRGLESAHEGFRCALNSDAAAAAGMLEVDDVPTLYWTAAAWAALISVSMDDPERIAQLGDVEVLVARTLELDETYGFGLVHELAFALAAGRSESMGGNRERARQHFERARQLSQQEKVAPLVSWAELVAVRDQDRKTFDEYLDEALAFDADSAPRFRLNNLISQKRARRLKQRAADLFLEGE